MKKFPLFKRYLTQFILLAYIPAVIACCGLFLSYSKLHGEIIAANEASVKLTQQSLDPIIQDLRNIIIRIDQDPSLSKYSLQHNTISALDTLEKILSQHSFLSDIVIKVRDEDLYYSSRGAFYYRDLQHQSFMTNLSKNNFSVDEFHQTFNETNAFTFWPTNVYQNAPDYLFVFSPICSNFQSGNPDASRVLAILIKQEYVYELFRSSQTDMEENLLLLNADFDIIHHLSPDISSESLQTVSASLHEKLSSANGAVYLDLDGDNYIFFVSYSEDTDLYYVRFLPEKTAFQTMYQFRITTALILSLVVILGIILIYVSMKRSYVPIKSLANYVHEIRPAVSENKDELSVFKHAFNEVVEENTSLSQKLNDSRQGRINQFLAALIQGNFADRESFLNACKNLKIEFDKKYYCVASIEIETESDSQEVSLHFGTISQSIHQSLPDHLKLQIKDLLFSRKLILVFCGDSSDSKQYFDAISNMKACLLSDHNLRTAIGVGSLCESWKHVGKSYLESINALDYRIIYGKTSLITPEMYNLSSANMYYPTQELNALHAALLAFNTDEAVDIVQQLYDYAKSSQCTLHTAKYICYDTFSTLKKAPIFANVDYVNAALQDLNITSLADFDTVDEFFSSLIEIIKKTVVSLGSDKSKVRRNIGPELVEYINSNCFSYDFQITSMAEHFSISPQHMRKLFKNHTNISISDYITNYKLERATQLLLETDMTLQNIVLEIGNADVSGFIRLFKQKTGMTPGQYRKAYAEVQDDEAND